MPKLTILILLVFSMVTLAGCGADQYSIEKEYYRIQKLAEKIFNNPHASPPKQLEDVVNKLETFIQKYPQNSLATMSEFTIARLYTAKEEFEKARAQLKALLNKSGLSERTSSEALFWIGNAYEIEDKWDLALKHYRRVMQEYSQTERGFIVPIYIAQHYKIKYQPDKMVSAFREAIAHYQKLAQDFPDGLIAYRANSLAAQCYLALQEWNQAIEIFEGLIEKYKGKLHVEYMMLETALIYQRELKQKAKAKELLTRLTQEYPRSPLRKQALVLLKELEKNE